VNGNRHGWSASSTSRIAWYVCLFEPPRYNRATIRPGAALTLRSEPNPASAREPDALDETLRELDEWLATDDDAPLLEVAEQTTYGAVVLDDLIRRQRNLSLSVAAVFLSAILGLPIFNLLFADLSRLPVLGLSLAWLLLAALVFPILWLLALYYVSTSQKLEDEFTDLVT
jgi:hypothetical protein